MKKKIQIILLVLVLAVSVGGYVAYRMWNKPHADALEMDGIKITAEQLVSEFESNEEASNAKYLSKVLEVQGVVSEINDQDTLVFVNLSYPDAMFGGVQVTVDSRFSEDARKLKAGDQATFKGFCNGYLMDVVLKDAVLVK